MVQAPRRAAVLGHPIEHSLSPALHRAAYEELGLSWEYSAVDVTAAGLPGFLDSLGDDWAGLSLTMPLKETVIELLTEVAAPAMAVRAVNTVVIDGSTRRGFNTDITGLQSIFAENEIGSASSAVVIGSGATARSSVAALAAVGVPRVVVCARRQEAGVELGALAERLGLDVELAEWPPRIDVLAADIVVSTVPAEAAITFGPPLQTGLLVDVLYHPWPTPLARDWAAAGWAVVGGLELLVRQAVEQVVLMTGRRPAADHLRAAGVAALAARSATSSGVEAGASEIAQAEQ